MSGDIWRDDYREFVGFYWTLPMPVFGFKTLSEDPDEAATQSRTIRYQRERVRQHVELSRGSLINEIVFCETQPDRASEGIEAKLARALKACRGGKAQLLYVDFAQERGWRSHTFLSRLMQEAPISRLGLDPTPLIIGGRRFDPITYFKRQRKTVQAQPATPGRHHIADKVKAVAKTVPDGVGRYAAIAKSLNEADLKTATGRT
jgi:hypothetical protein